MAAFGVWVGVVLVGGSFAQPYNGAVAGERADTAVGALGDINGDGVPDLAVGAPAAMSDAGRVRWSTPAPRGPCCGASAGRPASAWERRSRAFPT
jgi:hypothetical protein